MQANEFLQAYMAKNLGASGQGPLLAAQVQVPNLDGPKAGYLRREQMDIPGVADDATVQPIGLFGDELAPNDPKRKYGFTHQDMLTPQRGVMEFVQGGIPAPAGYNMDASRAKFPSYFDGVNQGNVPAFIKR